MERVFLHECKYDPLTNGLERKSNEVATLRIEADESQNGASGCL